MWDNFVSGGMRQLLIVVGFFFLNNDIVFGFSIVAVSGSGLLTGGLDHKILQILFSWNRWSYASQLLEQNSLLWLECMWVSDITHLYVCMRGKQA